MGALLEVFTAGYVALAGITGFFLVFLGFLVVISDYIDGWRSRRALGDIPIVDEGSNLSPILRWNLQPFDAETEFTRAYYKYSKNGKPFAARVQHGGYAIALPPSACRQVRATGHEQLSFLDALAEGYQGPYSLCLPNGIPNRDKPESTELNTLKSVFAAISALATALILGPDCPAALVSEITAGATAYNEVMMQCRILRAQYPRILKPLVWRFSRTARELRVILSHLKARLAPEIKRRIANLEVHSTGENQAESAGSFSLLDILIQTTFKNRHLPSTPAENDKWADLLCQQALLYHFKLARAPGTSVTFMLYRVMNHPEYAPMLRNEMIAALKRSGDNWTVDILQRAPKLESFNKETFRMHDISNFVGLRVATHPVDLKSVSPPLHLKPGTMIMTPSRTVHYDAEHYVDPLTFNGLRFYDAASNTCTPRVFTTSPTYLSFSHGTGSCPARNFATQIARMLFIRLLMGYEFELANEEMPAYGLMDGAAHFPNPEVRMRVRVREK
ncbi:cytochrome P450 [Aspergillus falconensis]